MIFWSGKWKFETLFCSLIFNLTSYWIGLSCTLYGYEMDARLRKGKNILGGNKKWHFYRPRAKLCILYTFGKKKSRILVLRGDSLCLFHFQLDMKCSAKKVKNVICRKSKTSCGLMGFCLSVCAMKNSVVHLVESASTLLKPHINVYKSQWNYVKRQYLSISWW